MTASLGSTMPIQVMESHGAAVLARTKRWVAERYAARWAEVDQRNFTTVVGLFPERVRRGRSSEVVQVRTSAHLGSKCSHCTNSQKFVLPIYLGSQTYHSLEPAGFHPTEARRQGSQISLRKVASWIDQPQVNLRSPQPRRSAYPAGIPPAAGLWRSPALSRSRRAGKSVKGRQGRRTFAWRVNCGRIAVGGL